MRARKRIALRLLCLLAAVGMLSGCGSQEASRELDIDDWQSWRNRNSTGLELGLLPVRAVAHPQPVPL